MSRAAQWEEVRRLFDQAIELPEEQREAFLVTTAADRSTFDAALRLLKAHEQAGGFLAAPAAEPWLGPRLESGERLGPYGLISELARGGMGVVWLATDLRLQRRVAIKFHLAPFSGDTLLDEARAAAALHHPGICPVYDVGRRDDGCAYFVMPYYEGETLAQRLRHGALSTEAAVDIARQAAEALLHAHAAGIVHRDIKPSNLMLVPGLGVRVLDFGIARAAHQSHQAFAAGTPAYMPPEQAMGEPPNARSDIWSLAVVLHEMLTGRRPGPGIRPPERFDPLFSACLSPEPENRPDAQGFLRLLSMAAAPAAALLAEPSTTFHGREVELRELTTLIRETRLVTLTGPGGAGKTRLAVRAANLEGDAFDGGIHLAELGELREPAQLGFAVADALGLGQEFGRLGIGAFQSSFGSAKALLILDNLEHLLESAGWLSTLLAACPSLNLLVTSRAPLRLSAEREYPVGPLPHPPSKAGDPTASPAVALFSERARRADPAFRLTSENSAEVAEICRLLDCLPLAIELTAPRIRLFTPRQLLDKLTQGEASSRGGPRDLPSRQKSLQATFEWSLNLLSPDERLLLQRLAVCEGAFPIELAAALGRDAFSEAAIETLIDHSLLTRDDRAAASPRFKWLQTIRAYALQGLKSLGQEQPAREAHFRWHADLARRSAPLLIGEAQQTAAAELSAAGADLDAALQWAVDNRRFEDGLDLAAHLWRLWIRQGAFASGLKWLEQFLDAAAPDTPAALKAEALLGAGMIAQNLGLNRRARAALSECLSLRRLQADPQPIAAALNSLVWVACELSDLEEARARCDEALAIAERSGDPRVIALAWNNSGWIAGYQGSFHLAENCFLKSLALRREAEDRRGEAFQLANAGWAQQELGKLDEARASVSQALRILEEVRDPVLVSHCLLHQGLIALHAGQAAEAVEPLDKAIRLASDGGNRSILAGALTSRGEAALALGDSPMARALLEESVAVWREIESRWGEAASLSLLAEVLPRRESLNCLARAMELRLQIDDRAGLATGFLQAAHALAEIDPGFAGGLLDESRTLAFQCGIPWPPRRPAGTEQLQQLLGLPGERVEGGPAALWARAWALLSR